VRAKLNSRGRGETMEEPTARPVREILVQWA